MDWLDYMRYAGVEHFYLYDNCQHEDECVSELASSGTERCHLHPMVGS
jgi:hypothetical protein